MIALHSGVLDRLVQNAYRGTFSALKSLEINATEHKKALTEIRNYNTGDDLYPFDSKSIRLLKNQESENIKTKYQDAFDAWKTYCNAADKDE